MAKQEIKNIVYKESGRAVIDLLASRGYNSARIREENLISQPALQKLRHDKMVSMESLQAICNVLKCQPGKIIKWVENPEESD